jgi:hypothetical protein
MLEDPHHVRQDLALMGRWPIPEETRRKAVEAVSELLGSRNDRVKVAAVRALARLDQLDQAEAEQERRAAAADRDRPAPAAWDPRDGDPAALARAHRAYAAALERGVGLVEAAHAALKAANHPEAEETPPCGS